MTNKIINKLFTFLLAVFFAPVLHAQDEQKLTTYELGRQIMSFHDTYQEGLSETIDSIIAREIDPTSRMIYQTIKVFYVQSSIDIVSDTEPLDKLINMLIMLRLQKLVWKEGGHDLATKDEQKQFIKTLDILEKDFHKLASRVFRREDISTIMSMAEAWKQRNPDRQYVAFVRFSDIEDSDFKTKIKKVIAKGGFFSSISDAASEIEETRHLMEKALFVAHHMPILMQWHSQLFVYKMLATGEVKDLLNQSERLTLSAERISEQIEKMPSDLDKLLIEGSKPVQTMMQDVRIASENLKVITTTLKPLLESDDSDEPIELARIERMFELAVENSRELVTITENINKFSYDNEAAEHLVAVVGDQLDRIDEILDKRVDDVDNRLIQHRKLILDQFFIGLLVFCLLFPVVFFTVYLLVRRYLINYHKKVNNVGE